jgi:hypothetical protein
MRHRVEANARSLHASAVERTQAMDAEKHNTEKLLQCDEGCLRADVRSAFERHVDSVVVVAAVQHKHTEVAHSKQ